MTFLQSLIQPFGASRPPHADGPAVSRLVWGACSPLRFPLALLLSCWLLLATVVAGSQAAIASPGLCVGPVCADEIARSAKHHWQLRLRLADQAGQRERITIDCRDGRLSPESGRIDRAYATALARKACRL